MASGRITTHSILKIDLIVGVRVSCFPGGSVGKESACNSGDPGLIAGLGRSPEEGNCYPLGVLVWRIPWREEPGGLQSVGSQRVRYD